MDGLSFGLCSFVSMLCAFIHAADTCVLARVDRLLARFDLVPIASEAVLGTDDRLLQWVNGD